VRERRDHGGFLFSGSKSVAKDRPNQGKSGARGVPTTRRRWQQRARREPAAALRARERATWSATSAAPAGRVLRVDPYPSLCCLHATALATGRVQLASP
jgi:hypothetical protein